MATTSTFSSEIVCQRSVTEASTQNGAFARLHLSKNTCTTLQKVMGFRLPTPIQRRAIPPILEGKDVVAMARTGSGKTVAFLAPLMDLLVSHSTAVGIRAIIVSPTRELAIQTASVTKKLMRSTNLKLAVLMGGAAMEGQFERLALNPDIVLATPGRLIHHLVEADLSLDVVQIVIVDEADRLFELGFFEQLQTLWEALPSTRQCVLISATLPAQLVKFSKIGLKEPVFVRLDAEKSLSPTLDLQFLYTRETEKVAALLRVAKKAMLEKKRSLIFVATRHHVEFCAGILQRLSAKVSLVYGKMDQECRLQQLSPYRKGESDFLVVTDVAARGLDMPLVDMVINYDFPSSTKLFIHRAGRTARNGKSGTAVSLVTQADLPYTVELLLFSDRKLILPAGDSIDVMNSKVTNPSISESKKGSNDQASTIAIPNSAYAQIGAISDLHVEIEYFHKLLEEDSELQSYYKSMLAAYKLYYKTRLSASSRSKDRAKFLLDSCGGAIKLSKMVHPAYAVQENICSDFLKSDNAAKHLIDEIHSFRPRIDRKSRALSVSVATQMARQKFNRDAARLLQTYLCPTKSDSITLERSLASCSETMLTIPNQDNASNRTADQNAFLGTEVKGCSDNFISSEKYCDPPTQFSTKADEPQYANLLVNTISFENSKNATIDHHSLRKVRKSCPRISKRRKRKQGEIAIMPSSDHCTSTNAPTAQFFLNAQISEKGLLRDDILSIQNAQLDVAPDEESDIKRSKHVQKWTWNSKRKKYEKGVLDASGKIMKDHKGSKIRGQVEKKGIYQKWMAASKRRIQRVGEKEDTKNISSASKRRNTREENQREADESLEPLIRLQSEKKKELLEHRQRGGTLTHKQQRWLKKFSTTSSSNRPSITPLRSELKTPLQIAKDRKKKANRAGSTTKATRIYRQAQKKKWETRHAKKIAQRGKPNRSLLIQKASNKKLR